MTRLEAGDVPSAVLLFEAAVQKDPAHAEVGEHGGVVFVYGLFLFLLLLLLVFV